MIVCDHVLWTGSGRVRYMNGSNVIDTCEGNEYGVARKYGEETEAAANGVGVGVGGAARWWARSDCMTTGG